VQRSTGVTYRERRVAVYVAKDRKQVLLRIDPAVHDALARWADDEFRSINAQIEMLLRQALTEPAECRSGRVRCHGGDVHRPAEPRWHA
jgi:hypothetical protein